MAADDGWDVFGDDDDDVGRNLNTFNVETGHRHVLAQVPQEWRDEIAALRGILVGLTAQGGRDGAMDTAVQSLRAGRYDLVHSAAMGIVRDAHQRIAAGTGWEDGGVSACLAASLGALSGLVLLLTGANETITTAHECMRTADLATILGIHLLPVGLAVRLCNTVEHALFARNVSSSDQGVSRSAAVSTPHTWAAVGPAPFRIPGRAVARIGCADVGLFADEYFNKHQPVTIVGLAAEWPMLRTWKNAESVAMLGEKFGHRTVPVEIRESGSGKLQEKLVSFGELCSELVSTDARAQNAAAAGETLPLGRTIYLAQHDLFAQIPGLANGYTVPVHCSIGRATGRTVLSNQWLGPGGTITRAHIDSYDNILVQATGRKYIRLYHKDQKKFLYVDAAAGGEDANGNMSQVPNMEQIDAELHPLAQQAAYIDVVLETGDALFIPEGWYHHVRSLSSISLSVNFWF